VRTLFDFQEIAIVYFKASAGNDDGFNQLFAYLQERRRCAVFGSIGSSIKDMYIWPLPHSSSLPLVLLPFDGPGEPRFSQQVCFLCRFVLLHLLRGTSISTTLVWTTWCRCVFCLLTDCFALPLKLATGFFAYSVFSPVWSHPKHTDLMYVFFKFSTRIECPDKFVFFFSYSVN